MVDSQETQLAPLLKETEQVIKQFLELKGVSFLPTQWQLASQTAQTPHQAVLQYLEFTHNKCQNYNDIKPNEFKHLNDGALCFLPDGSVYIKHNNQQAPHKDIKHAIELVEASKPLPQSQQLGMIEFWRLLRSTDWLNDSIKKGFSNFKPILVASVLINLLALAAPIFSIQVYDRIIPNQAFASLAVLVFGVLVCLFFELLLKSTRHNMMEQAATVTDTLCTKKLANTLLNVSTASTRPTKLLQHLRSFETLREVITGMFLLSLVDLPFMLVFLLVLTLIHPFFLIVALVILVLITANTIRLHRQLNKLGNEQMNQQRRSQSSWIETLNLLPLIQTLGVQNIWSKNLTSQQVDLRLTGNAVRVKITNATHLTYLFQQLGWITIISLGAWLTINNELTVGGMIAASMLGMRCFNPMQKLQGQLIQTHIAQAGFVDLNKFMQQEYTQKDKQLPLEPIKTISLNDIGFTAANNQKLITDITINLESSDRLGLIGPNGSGKTTLLKCLAGILKPNNGGYCLNQLDISRLSQSELAKQIGYAEQPPMLIEGTLLENIRFNRPWITPEQCLQATQTLGMSNWINQLPKGIHTAIDQGGSNLSSGLKQMVSLARAFSGQPKLLLLDEPTVCLDDRSENKLFEAVSGLPEDTILVMATHRTHLLRLTNRLVLLENGKISAQGQTQEVLLKTKNKARVK